MISKKAEDRRRQEREKIVSLLHFLLAFFSSDVIITSCLYCVYIDRK